MRKILRLSRRLRNADISSVKPDDLPRLQNHVSAQSPAAVHGVPDFNRFSSGALHRHLSFAQPHGPRYGYGAVTYILNPDFNVRLVSVFMNRSPGGIGNGCSQTVDRFAPFDGLLVSCLLRFCDLKIDVMTSEFSGPRFEDFTGGTILRNSFRDSSRKAKILNSNAVLSRRQRVAQYSPPATRANKNSMSLPGWQFCRQSSAHRHVQIDHANFWSCNPFVVGIEILDGKQKLAQPIGVRLPFVISISFAVTSIEK